MAWSPDSKRLATAGVGGNVKVWDAAGGRELLTMRGHSSSVGSVVWNPDGTRLATASWDGTTKVWDVASGKELLTLRGHTGKAKSVAWSPDGKRLATASEDGTVQIYLMDVRELLSLARKRVTRNFTPDECELYLQSRTCPVLP